MDRLVIRLFCSALFCSPFLICGQTVSSDRATLQSRLVAIKSRSAEHENRVRDLLAQPPLQETNFEIPVSSEVAEVNDLTIVETEPSFIPVPEYFDADEIEEVNEVERPPSADDLVGDPNVSSSNDSKESIEDLEKAYQTLYESNLPDRHLGYYFDFLVGVAIPNDGAVRDRTVNPYGKKHFESDSGPFIGLHLGKDFGSSRVEAEYNYLNFDGSKGVEVSSHNLMLRLILEYEVGERFDWRAGLGMGVGFLNFEHDRDYGGSSFSYDFLVGMGYRLGENWSLQLDYRYYLTAANDEYDRLQSHIILLSAGFDI